MLCPILWTGFPQSWKIIENPGKINVPGKSWKIDKNSKVMEKLKNHSNFGQMKKEHNF